MCGEAMAYPNSPEVGLEGSSGLDHLIKNTGRYLLLIVIVTHLYKLCLSEFENIQHTKAIETERERIKGIANTLRQTVLECILVAL